MLAIVLAHDGPLLFNERLHSVCFAQQLVILRVIELERVAFRCEPVVSFAHAKGPGVVMEPPAKDATEQPTIFFGSLRKEPACPIKVVDVCARGDEVQVNTVTRNRGGEAPVLSGVLFGFEVSTATPRLIPHAPELHAKRI